MNALRPTARKLIAIHLMAFVMLLVTWLAGTAIKQYTGSPLVALAYVLHIFPGGVIFVLILFEWLARNRALARHLAGEPWHVFLNHRLHLLYYLILLMLPISGILVFFEPASAGAAGANPSALARWLQLRPVYHLHALLFDLLLALVAANLLTTTAGALQRRP